MVKRAVRSTKAPIAAVRLLQVFDYTQWMMLETTQREITTPAEVHGSLPADCYSIPIFACKVEFLAEQFRYSSITS